MLPTPAIRSWVRRNALTGPRRSRASSRNASGVKPGSSGSMPTREARWASSASSPRRATPVPKRRGSVKSTLSLEARTKRTRRCGGGAGWAAGGGAEVGDGGVGPPDWVLAPPRQAGDPAARGRLLELLGRGGRAETRVEDLEALEHVSLHPRREGAADRLDLGQLGHGPSLGGAPAHSALSRLRLPVLPSPADRVTRPWRPWRLSGRPCALRNTAGSRRVPANRGRPRSRYARSAARA